jgi:hypothetical protein
VIFNAASGYGIPDLISGQTLSWSGGKYPKHPTGKNINGTEET